MNKIMTFFFALSTTILAMGATSQMGALRPSSVVVTNEDDAAAIAFSKSATNALWAATLALGDENLAAATNYAREAAYAAKTGAVQEATAGIDGSISAATNALWGSTVGLAERVFDEATNNTAEAVMAATNSILAGAYEHADAAAEAAKNEAVRQATNAVESAEERGRLALKTSTNALWTAVRSSTNDLWAATVLAVEAEKNRALAGEHSAKTGAVAVARGEAAAMTNALWNKTANATNALWKATKEETRGLATVAYVDAKTRVAESGHPEAIYDGTHIITAARGYLQVRFDDWYIDGSAWLVAGTFVFEKISESAWQFNDESLGSFSLQYGGTPARWKLYEPNNETPYIGMTAADHEMPETNATARALWWATEGEGTDGLLQNTTNVVGTLALEGGSGGGGMTTNAVREISGGVATNVVRGMAGEFGKVQSVNGQTGTVVLAAADVGSIGALWVDDDYYLASNSVVFVDETNELHESEEYCIRIYPGGPLIEVSKFAAEEENFSYNGIRITDYAIKYEEQGEEGDDCFESYYHFPKLDVPGAFDFTFASEEWAAQWTSNAVKSIVTDRSVTITSKWEVANLPEGIELIGDPVWNGTNWVWNIEEYGVTWYAIGTNYEYAIYSLFTVVDFSQRSFAATREVFSNINSLGLVQTNDLVNALSRVDSKINTATNELWQRKMDNPLSSWPYNHIKDGDRTPVFIGSQSEWRVYRGNAEATNAALAVVGPVSNAVSAWESYWSGDKVRLSVTNYYGNTSGESPRLRIEESQTNAQGVATNWVQVWDENTKYTNFTAGISAQVDGISNGVMTAAWRQTNLQLANKAPRAWQTVSSAGGYAPADTVWMTAPKTVFAGGTEWAHVAVGEGTIAVLVDKGAGVYTSGEDGVFRFTDESGENYFGFDVRASYTLGCRTDGIAVGEGNLVTLTYNLVAADNPQVLHCTNITANTWAQLGDGEISWEQNPPEGTKICYINTGGAPQGFYKAQIQYAGGSKFVTNMQADLAGGIAATNEALNVIQSIYPVITATGIVWRVQQ